MDGTQAKIEKASRVTGGELRVLRLLDRGFTSREVAEALIISKWTVDVHVANMFAKLKVNNRTRLLNEARRLGLVPYCPR